MSPDKPVTPVTLTTSPDPLWIGRHLSLANVRLLRMQNIERMFGGVRRLGDRCGCQKESRFPLPLENARLWSALVAADNRGFVRQASLCHLLKTSWLVWQPESVGFSWVEVVEIGNIDVLLSNRFSSSAAEPKTLEEWEKLGRSELKFRIFSKDDSSLDDFPQEMRISVVDEVLKRNPNFTHVNLMVEGSGFQSQDLTLNGILERRGLEMETLRPRLLPHWQSGDMDIQTFTTYTLRRKDTRALPRVQING